MNVKLDKDGAIATLTPDRPDKLNAMADEMWDALALACDLVLASETAQFSMAFKKVGVVPDGRLEAEARALAQELAESATHALALVKKMFHAMEVPTLEMLLEAETLASGVARLTHDHKEGVAAFKEKRPPRFLGR